MLDIRILKEVLLSLVQCALAQEQTLSYQREVQMIQRKLFDISQRMSPLLISSPQVLQTKRLS